MKLFSLFVTFFIFIINDIASAQNCSGADYSNVTTIIASLEASLNQTNSLINLIAPEYLFRGYSDYWSNDKYNLNAYSNNISYMAANNTNSLLAVFKGLKLAVNNQSSDSNHSLFDLQVLINSTNITIFCGGKDYEGDFDFNIRLQDWNRFISDLLSNVAQLTYAKLPQTSGNILKFLPSPIVVQGLIKNLQNVTNYYVRFMDTITSDTKNMYNQFKKSQPLVVAWDLLANQTLYNWTLATNSSQASLNSTITYFIKQTNAMYKSFIAQIPATLRNTPIIQYGEEMMASFNSSFLDNMQGSAVSLSFDSIRSILPEFDQMFSNIIQNIMMYHSQVITNYMKNASTLNCSIAFINATEALWKAYGGPKNFFNCSSNEKGFLPKLQSLLQVYLDTIVQDVNASYADLQSCLYIKQVMSDGINYSMEDCLGRMSSILAPAYSIPQQYSQNYIQSTEIILSNAYSRAVTCFTETQTGLQMYMQSILNNYNTCLSFMTAST